MQNRKIWIAGTCLAIAIATIVCVMLNQRKEPTGLQVDMTKEPIKIVGLPNGADIQKFGIVRMDGQDQYLLIYRPEDVMTYDEFKVFIGAADGLKPVRLLSGSRDRCGGEAFVTEAGTYLVEISPCNGKRSVTFKGVPFLKEFREPNRNHKP